MTRSKAHRALSVRLDGRKTGKERAARTVEARQKGSGTDAAGVKERVLLRNKGGRKPRTLTRIEVINRIDMVKVSAGIAKC